MMFTALQLKKHTKDIWWSISLALLVINSILLINLFMPKPEKEDLFITEIPKQPLEIGDYSAVNTPKNTPKQAQGAYVASKKGQMYYPLECAGAFKITEENKIWFRSKEEAEETGYKFAKTCL